MVGRSSDVSLSRFDGIRVVNVQENIRNCNVAVQEIDLPKTSTFKKLYIYPERAFILYNWYWSMVYTCVMDPSNKQFIFSEYSKKLFNTGEAKID